jgi:hypothetical protein
MFATYMLYKWLSGSGLGCAPPEPDALDLGPGDASPETSWHAVHAPTWVRSATVVAIDEDIDDSRGGMPHVRPAMLRTWRPHTTRRRIPHGAHYLLRVTLNTH